MNRIHITLLMVLSLIFLVFSGCKKTSPDLFSSKYQNIMRENALTEAAFDDVLKMAENIMMNNGNAKVTAPGNPVGCITNIDTVVTGPNTKRYTVTFPEGCTSYDGKTRTGVMYINLTGTNYNTPGSSITVTFSNYVINGNSLQGKLVSTNIGNEQFQVVISDDLGTGYASLYFTEFAKTTYWKSTHLRIIVAGDGDNNMINNKYLIHVVSETVMAFEGISTDNVYYFGNPVTTLTLDNSCVANGNLRYPIDGEILFKTDGQFRTVDYGDGDCDYYVTMYSGSTAAGFNLY